LAKKFIEEQRIVRHEGRVYGPPVLVDKPYSLVDKVKLLIGKLRPLVDKV